MPDGTAAPSGGALPAWLENSTTVPLFSPLETCVVRAACGGDSKRQACLMKNRLILIFGEGTGKHSSSLFEVSVRRGNQRCISPASETDSPKTSMSRKIFLFLSNECHILLPLPSRCAKVWSWRKGQSKVVGTCLL